MSLPGTPEVKPQRFDLSEGMVGFAWQPEKETADPVVLIHGFAASTTVNWVNTGWVKRLLAAGHRVLSLDLPGHGRSSDPVELEHYSRHALLNYIVELMDATNTQAAQLLGYSFGSRVAWQFAVEHPDRSIALGLGGSSPNDRLAMLKIDQIEQHLIDGSEIEDYLTEELFRVANLVPSRLGGKLQLARAAQKWPYSPVDHIPQLPIIAVTGTEDTLAADSPELIEAAAGNGYENKFVWVEGRDHGNVSSSREYKLAVIDFFAENSSANT